MSVQDRVAEALAINSINVLINCGLVVLKLLTGVLGHSFALIADALESSIDVFSSLVVRKGLQVSQRAADDNFHFGYGKADALSAAVVALLLCGASLAILIAGLREIIEPGPVPEYYTLIVLIGVVVLKEWMFRKNSKVGAETGSNALLSDAWHHRADALTSGAAACGIIVALIGGEKYASADDFAAIFCSFIIGISGYRLLKKAAYELMDRAPPATLLDRIQGIATSVPGVIKVEKLLGRQVGLGILIDMHVHADPTTPLSESHAIGGRVRAFIRAQEPKVIDVLVHMEPAEPLSLIS